MRMVVFSGNKPQLLLDDVALDANGRVHTGEVINGAWTLEITPAGVMLSKAGECVVSSCPLYSDYRQVEVPAAWTGDYNEVMARAERELLA